MTKPRKTKKGKKMKNAKVLKCPIYKQKKIANKMIFRGDKAAGLTIYPLDIFTCAKISDLLADGFSMKKLLNELLPIIDKYVEMNKDSEIKIDVSKIKENDPTINPLTFGEIKEVIEEIIDISEIIPNDNDEVNDNEIAGYVEISFKPLGIMECAEITDILSYRKNANQKIIELLGPDLLDYIDIKADFDLDVNKINDYKSLDNPFTYGQYMKLIRNLLTVSKVLPGDLEPFLEETK